VSKLPIVEAKTMDRVLNKLGFVYVRQRGSHVFYRHSDDRTTTLPPHRGRDLGGPLVREILREIDLSPEEFEKLI
jgi:predicted RNA binding protein YcfA (HicA-like mRNA interferase family)